MNVDILNIESPILLTELVCGRENPAWESWYWSWESWKSKSHNCTSPPAERSGHILHPVNPFFLNPDSPLLLRQGCRRCRRRSRPRWHSLSPIGDPPGHSSWRACNLCWQGSWSSNRIQTQSTRSPWIRRSSTWWQQSIELCVCALFWAHLVKRL